MGLRIAAPEPLGPRHGSQSAPGGFETAPRALREASRRLRERSGGLKTASRALWEASRWLQEHSRRLKTSPRALWEVSRRPDRRSSFSKWEFPREHQRSFSKLLREFHQAYLSCFGIFESAQRHPKWAFKDTFKEAVQSHSAQVSKILFSWLRAWLCTGSHYNPG